MTSCAPSRPTARNEREEGGPKGKPFSLSPTSTRALAGRRWRSRRWPTPGSGRRPGPDSGLEAGGIGEHVREGTFQAAGGERLDFAVELGADPGHTSDLEIPLAAPRALTKPLPCLYLAGGRPHPGLHHHYQEGPVDPAASLQDRGEKRPARSLGIPASISPARSCPASSGAPCVGRGRRRCAGRGRAATRVGGAAATRAGRGANFTGATHAGRSSGTSHSSTPSSRPTSPPPGSAAKHR